MSLDLRFQKLPSGVEIKVVETTKIPVYVEGWGGEDTCEVSHYTEVQHYAVFLHGKRLNTSNLMVYPWGGYSISARSGQYEDVIEALEKAGVDYDIA